MKQILAATLLLALAFSVAGPVSAQETDLPEAGMTPASPLYFLDRLFEGIGTFFAFGNSAKAERYLTLAEERLAEARVLAEDGDELAQAAVALYEEQYAKAKERATGAPGIKIDIELEEVGNRVIDATTQHLAVLDAVLERVPEQAKASIQAAKERSMTGQIEALRGLAERDPEAAIDIFARAAEGRLRAAEARAARGGDDTEETEAVEEALEEFSEYAAFGEEIASLAEGLRTGDTTVEELVERATAHHLDILKNVQSQVPAEAQESIRRAMQEAGQVQQVRPTIPAPAVPQPAQDSDDEEDEDEEDGEAGGMPDDVTPPDIPETPEDQGGRP